MIEIEYKMPPFGLGTDFTESERPLTFAKTYTNRFRNINGDAERRPGMNRYGSHVPGSPNLTRLHQWVGPSAVEVLMASDDSGNIWRYNVSASAWDSALTGKASLRLISAQAENLLIFCNGSDRNFYTNDGGVTFNELKALITTGKAASGTDKDTLIDGNISNWLAQTFVSDNDIVHNVTRGGYGIVSTVVTANLSHTVIGVSGNGAGLTSADQAAGDSYELIDYVDMDIIPDGAGGYDNIGTATTGTTTTVIAVSGVNFATTEIVLGDFVYNTTQGAIAQIGSVSANVNLQQTIVGQSSGDSLAFFKSAMPISSWLHVHYGRVYYLDARNRTTIIISAPDDPQDLSTYQQTLDSTSFSFGTQQPQGDALISITSFQQYFVASGEKNLYIYRGIAPIANTSTDTIDFTPISFYPNGVASRFGLGTNGTDLLHITNEGLQAVNIGSISFTTVQSNVSVPVRTTLLNAIANTANPDNIQLTFYPRRSWVMVKISDTIYVLNTNPSYDESGQQRNIPSWHLFAGKWAQQNHYFVNRSGALLACGAGGYVYTLDSSAATDDGQKVATDLVTSWLRMEEPAKTPRIKEGHYLRPIFESGANIQYTITAVAGWDGLSSDTILVSAGATGAIGSAIVGTDPIGQGVYAQADKYPLRWRGEQVRIEFQTNATEYPDILTGFMLYGDIGGVR